MDNDVQIVRIGFLYSAKNSKLPFYLSEFIKTAPQNKRLECVCFSLADINFNVMTVLATVVTAKGIFEGETQIPKFIFNFVYHTRLDNIKAMRQLRTTEGYKVINPTNRFNQAVIYEIVDSFPQSKEFLLPFLPLSRENISQQLATSKVLYLLPERGRTAQNAIRAQITSDNRVKICADAHAAFCAPHEVYDYLLKMTMGKKYLSMQGVRLLQRNGLPLTGRVFLQKNQKGQWSPTFAVAKSELFACNSLYQGTSESLAYALFEAAPEKNSTILESVERLSVMLCSYLDYYILDMASVFFDFIFSEDAVPYLLAFGGCEQSFYGASAENVQRYYNNIFTYLLSIAQGNDATGEGE